MVSESGQLYTIEGFAAALIMILTAIIVFGSATVISAGDEHITDMQLEQIANDALAMMDTPLEINTISNLSEYIQNIDKDGFNGEFMDLIKSTTGAATIPISDIQYESIVYYRMEHSDEIGNETFAKSLDYGGRDHAAREPSIRASRWVFIQDEIAGYTDMREDEQLVLLEVLIWRG
jgi:hypothetical protein